MKKTIKLVAKITFLVALSPVILLGMTGGLITRVAEAILESIQEAKSATKEIAFG